MKLKYLEIMPDNYFAPNHKFYSVMVQRYYAHFTRGRGNMGLATACSIAIKYKSQYVGINKPTSSAGRLIWTS